MNKRAAGEGSIYRIADGRWRASIDLGYGTGKRVRKVFTTDTRAEAAAKLKAALKMSDDGVSLKDDRLTVAAFFERWLEDAARPGLKRSAFEQYKGTVRRHVVPTLGKTHLSKLTALQLQHLYRAKLDSGLAPRTVLYIHRVIHRALGQAERWSLVRRNVADLVDAPRVSKTEVRAFTVEQARAFLDAVRGDRLESLYVVGLTAGLRRGEVLALRWDDIDLDTGALAVRRTLMKVPGGWEVAEPKTNSSTRVVKLPAFVTEGLRVHRVRQIEERLASPVWTDESLLFTTEVGTFIDGRNLLRLFKARLQAAGLEPAMFTFHGLRHSAATLMLALGIQPKVVMETLGHSRITVTMDVYSHVMPTMQDEAAAKMDALLRSR